jgi:hypothetical protein
VTGCLMSRSGGRNWSLATSKCARQGLELTGCVRSRCQPKPGTRRGARTFAPLLIWAARSPGQEDQEQSDNYTEQSDAEPRPAARHEAPLDEAGTLTNPDATDQDRESTDDHGDAACDLRRHVVRDCYRVTRNRRSSFRDGSPLPSVLELLNSRLFPSCATATVRSRP